MQDIIKYALENLVDKEPPIPYFFSEQELADAAIAELREHGFYPDRPCTIDIEMFSEMIAQVSYTDLPVGFEGLTIFIEGERPLMLISNTLLERENKAHLRFVFAHECGHIIVFHLLQSQNKVSASTLYPAASAYSGVPLTYRRNEWLASTVGQYLLLPPQHLRQVLRECWIKAVKLNMSPYGDDKMAWLNMLAYPAVRDTFDVSISTATIAIERFIKANDSLASIMSPSSYIYKPTYY